MVVVHYALGKLGVTNSVCTQTVCSRPCSFANPHKEFVAATQTVGYGNYVPYTSSGRAMVITLGFLSILAFAGILSVAGLIASAIFDDCLVRLRFKALTHPAVAMVVWGSLYYTWMVRWLGIPSPQYMLVKCFLTQTIVQAVIMAVVVEWMQARVGDTTFTNAEGYWFAYISRFVYQF
jgi:Ion channel